MNEQADAGWYPDGLGSERYWNGGTWTDHVRAVVAADAPKKAGAFSKLGTAVKNVAAEKKASKEEFVRKQAQDALAAGSLVTSGIFGTATIEVFENAYVRVASWGDGQSASDPKAIDKNTLYEKLRSIEFTQPDDSNSGGPSALEGAVGPTVAKLMKGGKGLMQASAPGMAAAGIAHVASNAARKSFLTIATDKQIHTLTNQTTNRVGLKTSNIGHNDVARALEVAGRAVLGVVVDVGSPSALGGPAVAASPEPTTVIASPSLSDRMRELAELHKDGILSDEEFASAKATLLGGL